MGGVTSNMAARLAFFPPDPPTYGVEEPPKAAEEVAAPPPPGRVMITGVPVVREDVEARRVLTSRGNEIVLTYVRNDKAKFTVLYSHGNAADLGLMYALLVELSKQLDVNLLGYDYSGYGRSSGKPSEQNTYADIEAAYKCLIETYGVKPENVILYGQSVGSGPTLDLASRLICVRAVILHSALLSGLRVMYPVKHSYWFDIYKGTNDDTIDWSHGKQLFELCQQKYEPLWIEGGGHCNLELYPQYMKHLKRFVTAIEKVPSEVSRTELSTGTSSLFEARRPSSSRSHISAKIMSSDRRERRRMSTGCRERPRRSTNKREQTRKSVDFSENIGDGTVDKPRKSIDRFGDMIKSVGLCNVDCFKEAQSKV